MPKATIKSKAKKTPGKAPKKTKAKPGVETAKKKSTTKLKVKAKALPVRSPVMSPIMSPAEIILKLWKAKQERQAQLHNGGTSVVKTDNGHNYFAHHKHEKFSRYNAPRKKAS